MAVSFHVGIPPNRPLEDFVDWIAQADELGFGGVWVADSQSVFRDACMALTLFARCTRRMELATAIGDWRQAAVGASAEKIEFVAGPPRSTLGEPDTAILRPVQALGALMLLRTLADTRCADASFSKGPRERIRYRHK